MKHFQQTQLNLTKHTQKLIDVTDDESILETIENYHIGKTNHTGLDETETRIKRVYILLA